MILRYGFMETPDVKHGLKLAISQGHLTGVNLSELTYYLGRETIVPSGRPPGMFVWREALFALLHRNAERSAAYFCCRRAKSSRSAWRSRSEVEGSARTVALTVSAWRVQDTPGCGSSRPSV